MSQTTKRKYESGLKWYEAHIGEDKFPYLSREDEDNYARLSKDGAEWIEHGKIEPIRNKIIAPNLRLVIPIARIYHNYREDIPLRDIISIGNIGLIKAAIHYDIDKNKGKARFFTYATYYIHKEISNAICPNVYLIKLSFNKNSEVKKSYRKSGGKKRTEEIGMEEELNYYRSILPNTVFEPDGETNEYGKIVFAEEKTQV